MDAGHYVDLGDDVPDFDEEFFGSGNLGQLPALIKDRVSQGAILSFDDQRIGSPIARPHQIICIGLNYRNHAIESGMDIPKSPIIFSKFQRSNIIGNI